MRIAGARSDVSLFVRPCRRPVKPPVHLVMLHFASQSRFRTAHEIDANQAASGGEPSRSPSPAGGRNQITNDHGLPSAGFARNQIMKATQKYELCPRMAWQYHGYGVQDTQHENSFLSVVLPRHPWACLSRSFLKRIEGRNRLVASSPNQDASTRRTADVREVTTTWVARPRAEHRAGRAATRSRASRFRVPSNSPIAGTLTAGRLFNWTRTARLLVAARPNRPLRDGRATRFLRRPRPGKRECLIMLADCAARA